MICPECESNQVRPSYCDEQAGVCDDCGATFDTIQLRVNDLLTGRRNKLCDSCERLTRATKPPSPTGAGHCSTYIGRDATSCSGFIMIQSETGSSNASVVKLRVAAQELRDLADDIDGNAENVQKRLVVVGSNIDKVSTRTVKDAIMKQMLAAKEKLSYYRARYDYTNKTLNAEWTEYMTQSKIFEVLEQVWTDCGFDIKETAGSKVFEAYERGFKRAQDERG